MGEHDRLHDDASGGIDRRGRAHRTCRRGQHAVAVSDRTHPRIRHIARHRHDPRPAATLPRGGSPAHLAGIRHLGRTAWHTVRLAGRIRGVQHVRQSGVPVRMGH